MKKRYLTVVVTSTAICMLAVSFLRAEDSWKPAAAVDLTQLQGKIADAAKRDKALLRQPTILAYKTALFLAAGSMDVATWGREQKVSVTFGKGEEPYTEAFATVEFSGYADDSLTGERFTLSLEVGEDGLWGVINAKRAAFGRGDHL